MFSKKEVERLFNEKYVWLRPPKYVYVLRAPVIYPEMKAKIFGLNPAFERQTIILASDATEETLVHETLHRMGLGEILTPRLAKKIVKFREKFPPILRRRVKYEERELTSEEVKRFGLHAYPHGRYKIKLLELKR